MLAGYRTASVFKKAEKLNMAFVLLDQTSKAKTPDT